MYKIESLLSARLFLFPQLVGDRIYFISNLSGRLSLYVMDYDGSMPTPLLPPDIALQNPHLIGGDSYYVFPELEKIVVMLDNDGNENYKPMFIPINGGYPEPVFGNQFDDYRVFMGDCDPDYNFAYIVASSHKEACNITYLANFKTTELIKLAESVYGINPNGHNEDHTKVALVEGYTIGDNVLYYWDKSLNELKLVYGTPIDEREEGQNIPLNSIHSCHFARDDDFLFFHTTLFEDAGGLGFINLDNSTDIHPLPINGVVHQGFGEFEGLQTLKNNQYLAKYNIDGVDWYYEGTLDEERMEFNLNHVIVGQGKLAQGVVDHIDYEKYSDNFAVSFSTAISPTQIFTVEGPERKAVVQHTKERIIGIPNKLLSPGEDASFNSFDDLQISARLYLPSEELGFKVPLPLVYYIHGGPQSQERPDFAWFSIPLIQFLTLNGFAVFVPNVRGSSGYGLKYTKKVDRDWGGDDRMDHVHALTKILPNDNRLDTSRTGVVGRSYGGYMTLTLAARHPELWSAACDMFGPYDLFTFLDRIPETWKPYFYIAIGHPDKDENLLKDRSPRTYIENISAPLLVIQGKNDPRVVEQESRDLVENLRNQGKGVEYLMFENEGHDVLKFENRVRCYNAITDFFKKYLQT